MATGPEQPDEASRWLDPPHNRYSFQRVEDILPVTPIGRGSRPARPLSTSGRVCTLGEVTIDAGGTLTLAEFARNTYTDGLLVLRDGQILVEHYGNGMTQEARHCLMSVSKSLAGALAGIVISDGLLNPSATVASIVPELDGSGYGDATVQQVLDMAVGLRFNQDYDDPDSEVQTEDRAAGWRPRRDGDPADSKTFLASLSKEREHGGRLNYCSTTTDVLAWLLENAAGVPYAQLLSQRIWSRIGAEHDAYVTVDASGFPYACAGVNATLRDLARFGQLILDGGTWNGEQVVPGEWIEQTSSGEGSPVASDPAHAAITAVYPAAVYHNQWWIPNEGTGSMYAAGIFGQYLWVDPATRSVLTKLSSLPAAFDPADLRQHVTALGSLATTLTPNP